MKLSLKLLIGLFIFFIASLFASNKLLKEEYDKYQKIDRSHNYWDYTKIIDKPFKHVKIENGNILGTIIIEQGDLFAMYLNKDPHSYFFFEDKAKITGKIVSDTLIVNIPLDAANSSSSGFDVIHIFAKQLKSVSCLNSHLQINRFNQKELTANLLGHSTVDVSKDSINTDTLNISLANFSKFIWNNGNTFQKVNAQLDGNSELDLGQADIKSLNFNTNEKSSIKLSCRSLKSFMK